MNKSEDLLDEFTKRLRVLKWTFFLAMTISTMAVLAIIKIVDFDSLIYQPNHKMWFVTALGLTFVTGYFYSQYRDRKKSYKQITEHPERFSITTGEQSDKDL